MASQSRWSTAPHSFLVQNIKITSHRDTVHNFGPLHGEGTGKVASMKAKNAEPWHLFYEPNDTFCVLRIVQNGRHFIDDILKCTLNENYFILALHDDVIKWKHFPRNWPFVREIHRSPVNFPHKGQWRGALMFSLIYAWINDWVNNREAGDLRRQHGHYDVIVMNFPEVCLQGSTCQWVRSDIDNGLAKNRRQAITWTNAEHIQHQITMTS